MADGGQQKYAVAFVDDDKLHDRDWAYIEYDDTLVLALKESAVCPRVIADAWASFRACYP